MQNDEQQLWEILKIVSIYPLNYDLVKKFHEIIKQKKVRGENLRILDDQLIMIYIKQTADDKIPRQEMKLIANELILLSETINLITSRFY